MMFDDKFERAKKMGREDGAARRQPRDATGWLDDSDDDAVQEAYDEAYGEAYGYADGLEQRWGNRFLLSFVSFIFPLDHSPAAERGYERGYDKGWSDQEAGGATIDDDDDDDIGGGDDERSPPTNGTIRDLMDQFLLYFDNLGDAVIATDDFDYVILNVNLLKDDPRHVRPVEKIKHAKHHIIKISRNIDHNVIESFFKILMMSAQFRVRLDDYDDKNIVSSERKVSRAIDDIDYSIINVEKFINESNIDLFDNFLDLLLRRWYRLREDYADCLKKIKLNSDKEVLGGKKGGVSPCHT